MNSNTLFHRMLDLTTISAMSYFNQTIFFGQVIFHKNNIYSVWPNNFQNCDHLHFWCWSHRYCAGFGWNFSSCSDDRLSQAGEKSKNQKTSNNPHRHTATALSENAYSWERLIPLLTFIVWAYIKRSSLELKFATPIAFHIQIVGLSPQSWC